MAHNHVSKEATRTCIDPVEIAPTSRQIMTPLIVRESTAEAERLGSSCRAWSAGQSRVGVGPDGEHETRRTENANRRFQTVRIVSYERYRHLGTRMLSDMFLNPSGHRSDESWKRRVAEVTGLPFAVELAVA